MSQKGQDRPSLRNLGHRLLTGGSRPIPFVESPGSAIPETDIPSPLVSAELEVDRFGSGPASG